MSDELLQAYFNLREKLKTATDAEREEVFRLIGDGYCRHCGIKDRNCQCWNDE